MVNTAKSTPHEVGEASKKVASIIPKFVTATQFALSSITDKNAQHGLLNSAKGVIQTSDKIVQVKIYILFYKY